MSSKNPRYMGHVVVQIEDDKFYAALRQQQLQKQTEKDEDGKSKSKKS